MTPVMLYRYLDIYTTHAITLSRPYRLVKKQSLQKSKSIFIHSANCHSIRSHFLAWCLAVRLLIRATPHNLARRLSQDFCSNSKFGKWRNTVCTRKGHAASVSQLVLATAAQYFPFFKLKKWGKKTAEARRHNCAGVPYGLSDTKI